MNYKNQFFLLKKQNKIKQGLEKVVSYSIYIMTNIN